MANNSSSSPDEPPGPVAKSQPQVPISDHSDRVRKNATDLLDSPVLAHRLDTFDIDAIDAESLRELGGIAADYHDTGKAHPAWQEACLAGEQVPPHSARSALYAFAALQSSEYSKLGALAVVLAILHHHTPFTAEHMQPDTIDVRQVTGSHGERMVQNLEAAGYPSVTLSQETVDQFQTQLKFCREQLTASRQPEQYRQLGLLVTILRAALIQADHYASAAEQGQEASLPNPLDPDDIALHSSLRPFQKQIAESLTNPLIGLAGCGEGKTQTAFQWGQRMLEEGQADRLVFAMPTQVTTNNLLLSITGGDSGEQLAHVSHDQAALYHSAGTAFFEDESTSERWETNSVMLSERARRWFQNPVTVSTVDHILSTLINGYRGATIARGNLLRSAIVFDEIHAYDDQMTGHLLGALNLLSDYGIPWYVMTATLPPTLWEQEAFEQSTVVRSEGRLRAGEPPREPFEIAVEEEDLTATRARERATELNARRVMVVKNTVAEARELATTLRDAGEEVIYYSSEFIRDDRREKENEIREAFSNEQYDDEERRQFLVSTQVCEISLDLSADLLLTEVAPLDALLQRAGRLHRAGVKPDADSCQTIRACEQCRAQQSGFTYECRIFAPLEDAQTWYPYAEGRGTPMWTLLEQTAALLEDIETYRFDRSLEWLQEAYSGISFRYNTSELQIAMADDWVYGPRRMVGEDATEGEESLQLRDISTYRRTVLAAKYEDSTGAVWTPDERWTEFHDCSQDVCGVQTEQFNECQSEFQEFLQRYGVDIPRWWIQSDDVPVDNPKPLTVDGNEIPGSEVVNVQYSYEWGLAPK